MTTHCPACKKVLKAKGLALHIKGCPDWAAKVGVPSSEFNFDEYFQRGLYEPHLVENVDYLSCKICGYRKKRISDHVSKVHGYDPKDYRAKYNALTSIAEIDEKRKATVKERFGVENVFQDGQVKDKIKETNLGRYGVENIAHNADVKEKRKATNLKRYGVENVFAADDIKERIKRTNLERYGVENPNQSADVMQRRIETNLERYGVEHYVETGEFKEKSKGSSLERYGVEHPMKSDAVQQRQQEVVFEKYGVRNVLLHREIYGKSYETNLANNGGKHHTQTQDFLDKSRATCLERYGVDNPSKAQEVKDRIKETWLEKYGVPFPPQSLQSTFEFPNKLERYFDSITPERLVYSGDHSYWLKHSGAERARNPDFVYLSETQYKSYLDGAVLNDLRVCKVVEVFGDYWHGEEKTGKSNEEHEAEVIEYYSRCGVGCLVVWEGDIRRGSADVVSRVRVWLGGL